jgi:phospholipase/carboxylesterase
VQALLRAVRARHQPDTLVLGGFSQGAMLSLDVALAAEPAVDRVVALSGLLLADSLPGLRAARPARPAIFASHGRQDPVLPFAEGEQARTLLASAGFSVTWRPFDGGHTIPPPIVEALDGFLFGS